jgi:hypothetical protein
MYGPLQPQRCYHCNKRITKRDDLFDAFSGEYFSNVKGKWLCRKCWEILDAAETKTFRTGLAAGGHKPKLMPILTVPIKLKVKATLGKPIKHVDD